MTSASRSKGEDVAPVRMPIGSSIYGANERFSMGRAYENAAQRNHNQSLAEIAARGGLTWCEGAAIVEMRPWWQMDQSVAEATVRAHLTDQEGQSR